MDEAAFKSSARDPLADPDRPRIVTFHDVSAAAFRIRGAILRTPCTLSHISETAGMEIYFKREFLQYTGSFKERGARYALLMLPEEKKQRGVVTASTGNHALALSYHGKQLGIPVTLVVPNLTPMSKLQQCRMYGASVIVYGNNIAEARDHALKLMVDKDLTFISEFDHPHVIAGHGTLGLEIVEQMDNIDALVIPVGGGALIAGTAVAVKTLRPNVTIIGVEPDRCPSFTAAQRSGKPVTIPVNMTIAEGLAIPTVGVNSFATASPLIDKMVTVSEEMIAIAILRLMELEKAVIEGAGAVALAAIFAGLLPELRGKKVVVPLGGGNIDTTILGRCLERGLAADGRLVKFTVTVSDRPGGIADLARCIADLGVTIKDIIHERAWLRTDVFNVRVKVVAETRDRDHARELESVLKSRYSEVYFNAGPLARKGSVDRVEKSKSRSKSPIAATTDKTAS